MFIFSFKKLKAFLFLLLLFIFFACKTGNKKVTEKFADGSPKTIQYIMSDSTIKETAFYQNHTKRYEGEYKHGQRNGHWIYWYEDGKVWSEGYFNMGENDSIRIVYHQNGNKYYSGKYRKGKRVGIWKFWDNDGNFVKQIDYGQ